jgi:hypothetical protein
MARNARILVITQWLTVRQCYLLDDYENPIKVNRHTLLWKATQVHTKVMEEWYTEFEELKNTR